MKYMVTLAIILAIAVLALALPAIADVPQIINYQGRLTDSATGDPYDGNATIIFSIWDDSSSGTRLWEETHPIVVVSNGLFNVLLGSVDSIPDSVFDQPSSWLEVIANGNLMEPRTQIVSVGYAYHALRSDTAGFALSTGNGWVDDGAVVRLADTTDNVGIGTDTPSAKLTVVGNSLFDGTINLETSSQIEILGQPGNTLNIGGPTEVALQTTTDTTITFLTDNVARMNISGNGNIWMGGSVGIGTTNPQVKLQVDGGMVSASSQPRAKVFNSTSQTVPNGQSGALSFDSEVFDIGELHSTTTNNGRITIPTGGDGVYLIVGQVSIGGTGGVRRLAVIYKGEGYISQVEVAPKSGQMIQVTVIDQAVAGNYYTLRVYQDSGDDLTVWPQVPDGTWLSAVKLW